MGEIEKIVEIGKLALRQQGATALTVADALLDQVDYEKAKEPKAPAAVAMTDELREALEMLPKVFGQAQVTEIRQLTETERRALGEEQRVVEAILKPLEMRAEAIKETVRHHMDQVALAEGKVGQDTETDRHGHYVIAAKGEPERVAIPGTDKEWSREYRAGAVSIEGHRLLEMYEAGEIDRKTYLAMTRQVRVFDEHKALAAMEKDPGLLPVFRKLIKRGRPVLSLYVRKAKKK